MTTARVFLAFVLGAAMVPALAWDDVGHMTVAAIAYEKLTPAARRQTAALLKLNPQYADWQAVAKDAEEGEDRIAFMMAATWPDAIKRMGDYQDDGEIPNGPDASRNLGYADKLMHKYWHYIDLPFSPDKTPLANPRIPNAQTQIGVFRRVLAQPSGSEGADDELKSYDLVWLLHLVGDVHQPLHATSRFDKDFPAGDAGGNQIRVCTTSCGSLHAFWDSLLEPAGGHVEVSCKSREWLPTSSQCAALKVAAALDNARAVGVATRKSAADTNEAHWIEESFALAKSRVYSAPVGLSKGPYNLDYEYEQAARKVGAQRAALAGARLANVLNQVFR